MVLTIPIYDASVRLADLVRDLAPGDEIVLTEEGNFLARIIPEPGGQRSRQPGACKGMLDVRDDGDEAILEHFKDYLP